MSVHIQITSSYSSWIDDDFICLFKVFLQNPKMFVKAGRDKSFKIMFGKGHWKHDQYSILYAKKQNILKQGNIFKTVTQIIKKNFVAYQGN